MTISSASAIKKLLLLFLVIAGLYYARKFLMPLSIGAVLATLFLPLCRWMEERKVPRGLAALVCLLVLLLFIVGVGILLSYQISSLTNDFSIVRQRSIAIIDNVQKYIFTHLGISIEKQNQVLSKQEPAFTRFLKDIAISLPSFFTNFILTLVYILFLLYYRSHIKQFILKISSASQQNEMDKVIDRVGHVSQHYLLGLSKMIVCLWIMYGICFSILDVENELISTAETKTFNGEIGTEIAVNRHFVCNNTSEAIFTLPQANTVNAGFNLTFDIVNSGNLVFEVANTTTDAIRFGPNRVNEVHFIDLASLPSETLGDKQFTDVSTQITINNSILTFSGQQNIYTLKFIRINSTDYMLAR